MTNLLLIAALVVGIYPAGTKDPHDPSRPLRTGLPHPHIDEYCGRLPAKRGVDPVTATVRYPDPADPKKDCVLFIAPELKGLAKGPYVLGLFDTETKDWLKDLYPFAVP